MKTSEIKATVFSYDRDEEMDSEARALVISAREALLGSYSPYSGFSVGAAVLLENGKVVKGSNQENAAYPSGLCAERVALYAAAATYPGIAMKAIAIAVESRKNIIAEPAAPCGNCRQSMAEYESVSGKKIRIIMSGQNGKTLEIKSVKELLPLMFEPGNLG